MRAREKTVLCVIDNYDSLSRGYHDIATWWQAFHEKVNYPLYCIILADTSNTEAISLAENYRLDLVLKPVYTRAGGELTDPQEGCKLKDIKLKHILRRTAMLRSRDA